MAKKKGMNILVAHLEKIFLALALSFLGWVFYSRFMSPSDGSASEMTQQAAEDAEDHLSRIKAL